MTWLSASWTIRPSMYGTGAPLPLVGSLERTPAATPCEVRTRVRYSWGGVQQPVDAMVRARAAAVRRSPAQRAGRGQRGRQPGVVAQAPAVRARGAPAARQRRLRRAALPL